MKQLELFDRNYPEKTKRVKTQLNYKDRKLIEQLINDEGVYYSLGAIAEAIGRSKNGVITEVRRNGGRDVYNAQMAQKRACDLKKLRVEKLQKAWKENPMPTPYAKMKERIENLELQIEILIDTIKDMKNDKKN